MELLFEGEELQQEIDQFFVVNEKRKSKTVVEKFFSKDTKRVKENSGSIVQFFNTEDSFSKKVVFGCSPDDRRRLYELSKNGFSYSERRDCWLIGSGALQAMASASGNYYKSLVDHCNDLLKIGFPSSSYHQICIDLPRTFSDKQTDMLKADEVHKNLEQVKRICFAYSVRNP